MARDLEQARLWFERSAIQGYAHGQFNLGHLYETGRGGGQDDVQAYKWYKLALEAGYPRSSARLKVLNERMSSEQMEAASDLAGEWERAVSP